MANLKEVLDLRSISVALLPDGTGQFIAHVEGALHDGAGQRVGILVESRNVTAVLPAKDPLLAALKKRVETERKAQSAAAADKTKREAAEAKAAAKKK